MNISNGFDISASALTAQRLRMDIIASNIANANTTRGTYVNGKWIPYQRKLVEMQAIEPSGFANALQSAVNKQAGGGVEISQVINDPTPFKRVYDPTNPDAGADGYVLMPNVDMVKEMADMISATRSYEANVTALNATKSMISKALEIGK
ncbi:MAG: flagellar basal body rod protein FlgC [Paenibacillus sp. RIFOXYA1_FULL_44_5]|nr:MAG: flagellar basal body rod protein FlgC [Paenibacillus sp. RIFOXYA1_FULL_44_5]